MQLRAVDTFDACHWFDIGSVVVKVLQRADDGLKDSLANFIAYGSNGHVTVFAAIGIEMDLKVQRMELQGNFILLTIRTQHKGKLGP